MKVLTAFAHKPVAIAININLFVMTHSLRFDRTCCDDLHDLRSRVIGQPEISTDGFHPYRVAIGDAFGDNASHGE
jgi:hypothetical protein